MTYVTTVDGGTVLFCNIILAGGLRCNSVLKLATEDHDEALRQAAAYGWSHNAIHGLDKCGSH